MAMEGKKKSQPSQFREVYGVKDAPASSAGPTVVATRKGFYNGKRLRPGAHFTLNTPNDFNPDWMKKAGDVPGKPAAGKAAIDAGTDSGADMLGAK